MTVDGELVTSVLAGVVATDVLEGVLGRGRLACGAGREGFAHAEINVASNTVERPRAQRLDLSRWRIRRLGIAWGRVMFRP